MSQCRYLKGENIAPLRAPKIRSLVGHTIQYIRSSDIDKSGRGYISPQNGVIVGCIGKNIELDVRNNYFWFPSFIEVVDLGVLE